MTGYFFNVQNFKPTCCLQKVKFIDYYIFMKMFIVLNLLVQIDKVRFYVYCIFGRLSNGTSGRRQLRSWSQGDQEVFPLSCRSDLFYIFTAEKS